MNPSVNSMDSKTSYSTAGSSSSNRAPGTSIASLLSPMPSVEKAPSAPAVVQPANSEVEKATAPKVDTVASIPPIVPTPSVDTIPSAAATPISIEAKKVLTPETSTTAPTSGSAGTSGTSVTRAATSSNSEQKDRPTICIRVPLVSTAEAPPNAIIDFNRLAEEAYGFDAVHPEIRTALDLADDDDMEDDEDDALTGGMVTAPDTPGGPANKAVDSAVETAAKKKSRSKVEGKYDLNDDFIDDSELAWETTAAATKDGFFVYWGPLVVQQKAEIVPAAVKRKATGPAGRSAAGSSNSKPKVRRKKAEPAASSPKKS